MPNQCVIIAFEDVLAYDEVLLYKHASMFKGFATEFRMIVLATGPRERAQRVMKSHGLRYDLLLDKGASILDDVPWKVAQVKEIMGMGWPIGYYIDVDPRAVREVLAYGVTTLLLSHRMLRPAWLPSDGPPRAWEDLVNFSEAQDEHTADSRQVVDEVSGGDGRRWG